MAPLRSIRNSGGLLPPPYSYDKLYSSYRVEWEDRFRQQAQDDMDITDVKWLLHHRHKTDGLRERTNEEGGGGGQHVETLYLLGCTSLGEVVVWEVPTWNTRNGDRHPAAANLGHDRDPLYRPCIRVRLPSSVQGTGGSADPPPPGQYKMQVVSVPSSKAMQSAQTTIGSRKRNRAAVEGELNDAQELTEEVLLVAGGGGLWRISVSGLIAKKGKLDGANDWTDMTIKSLIRENRPISHIQTFSDNERFQRTTYLYALQQDCISKWSIIDDGDGEEGQPIATYPLAPLLNQGKGPTPQGRRERATAMQVVSNPSSVSTAPVILVGTSRGRVLIVPTDPATQQAQQSTVRLPAATDGDTTKGTAPGTQCLDVGGTVTSIMETNRTWWTIAAAFSPSSSSTAGFTSSTGKTTGRKLNSNGVDVVGGCLSTWHAPTLALVASCPTRESIHSIQAAPAADGLSATGQTPPATSVPCPSSPFYTIGNESVVSLWKSPYQLVRSGRVWATAPSCKAIAICTNGGGGGGGGGGSSDNTPDADDTSISGCMVAVAGVGSRVDIVVDRCCIETLHL